jgi:hypothetical protein
MASDPILSEQDEGQDFRDEVFVVRLRVLERQQAVP